MQYRYLGRTGMKVSELCLGAMTFGRETPEPESYQMLDTFVEAGGNFIDTANVYSYGLSETILGKWLKDKKRDDYVIATKVRWGMSDGVNEVGLSRKHVLAQVEGSLERLGTDYIDLYQIHGWDPGTPLEETMHTLNTLVESGKVRYIGASNVSGWQLQAAIDISNANGWEPFVCLQPLYNLLDRSIEWELIPVCERNGVGVIPWSPLRGGWLSGKYQRGMDGPISGTRVEEAEQKGWSETWTAYNNEHTWKIIDAMFAVAEEAGKSPAQVALRWLIQRPAVTAPIIGARTMAHLKDNLGAAGWELSKAQMQKLTESDDTKLPYPYEMLFGRNDRSRD
ncbi:MAG: aldo/keto reductase [Anaerolineales bacterium]|nr:aldo/keto reductase [Anaerolineales bacterium]